MRRRWFGRDAAPPLDAAARGTGRREFGPSFTAQQNLIAGRVQHRYVDPAEFART
ncbi:MAG: hypothetical protein ABI329_05450 [Candidatus Tumulicola sp.]